MAWGLEARVPFLDKKFLEVSMNVDAKYKEFNKGVAQETDADGRPKMEKVCFLSVALSCPSFTLPAPGQRNQEAIADALPSVVHFAKGIRLLARRQGLPARLDPMATKGAILGRCRLLVD